VPANSGGSSGYGADRGPRTTDRTTPADDVAELNYARARMTRPHNPGLRSLLPGELEVQAEPLAITAG
jgi:hypothetical protein